VYDLGVTVRRMPTPSGMPRHHAAIQTYHESPLPTWHWVGCHVRETIERSWCQNSLHWPWGTK